MTTPTLTRQPSQQPSAQPPAATAYAVQTSGLQKAYGGKVVVDDLDLALPAGVVSGFVGPNGAGKTTTIRMLLGLVRPTAGSGQVLGKSISSPTSYLPQVGALIEGPAFTPSLSGANNLRVLARAGGLSTSRVGEVLERVGLRDRGDDAYKSYSLGMKQRLGIAAALLPQPKLLILDEPTNGLDPAGIVQVRDLITSFRDEGMTVLVSSHLLAEIEQVADHLVMIQKGRLVFQGPVRELVEAQMPELLARPERPSDVELVCDIAAALGWPANLVDGVVRVQMPARLDSAQHAERATELNRRAHAVGVTLSLLEVLEPTLEQAFFKVTGTTSGDVR
ncbi:MAG: type transport system ATP-binding protein [Actinomycetota bacterium]|jgi:ABC-2 type transport system ATP-binding protein|nr:type transport system ATP-binding protein [Actinomycetota bacterium]